MALDDAGVVAVDLVFERGDLGAVVRAGDQVGHRDGWLSEQDADAALRGEHPVDRPDGVEELFVNGRVPDYVADLAPDLYEFVSGHRIAVENEPIGEGLVASAAELDDDVVDLGRQIGVAQERADDIVKVLDGVVLAVADERPRVHRGEDCRYRISRRQPGGGRSGHCGMRLGVWSAGRGGELAAEEQACAGDAPANDERSARNRATVASLDLDSISAHALPSVGGRWLN